MLRGATPSPMIYGLYIRSQLPDATQNSGHFILVTDDPVTGECLYLSDGAIWLPQRSGVQADWNATSGLAQIANKPSLATVATSGAYGDLSGRPTIPGATQAATLTTDSTGSATWTYGTSYAAVPVIEALAISPTAGSTDVFNVQLDGAPTATQAKFKVTRTQVSVVALLGLSILSIPSSVGNIVIHVVAKVIGL